MESGIDDNRVQSTGLLARFLRRRRLFNGRYERRDRKEHFCMSRRCCLHAEDCLRQMDSLIDDEGGPQHWHPGKFMGFEDTLEWEL